ncbi:subtilisin-like protein [Neoconidiobolus thromboides FSU 785]|nr:subtilisin-like protein [Neoconidiobolus thromboides FSU 785]
MNYLFLILIIFNYFLSSIHSIAQVSATVLSQLKNNESLIDCLIQLTPPNIESLTNDPENIITTLKSHSNESQKKLKLYLQKQQGLGNLNYLQSYYISNTIAIKAKPELIEQLMSYPGIKEISTNRKFKAGIGNLPNIDNSKAIESDDWTGGVHWSIKYINATGMKRNVLERASKLIYGNADTGVEYTHPALFTNYMGNKNGQLSHDYSWWDANKQLNKTRPNGICGINSLFPCDDNNHGTHTMSTVVGQFGLGVSPTTLWIACKNMDQNFGSPESYLGCLQFFIAPTDLNGNNPKPELRPHVIGNSYGCPPEEGCSRTTFGIAMKALKKAGIFLSVSAGNEGSLGCSSMTSPPAIDPSAFSVAANGYLTLDRPSFSSMGPVLERKIAIDVTAPGVNITGAIRGGKYSAFQGTSMAAPHVSGAALLIMAACPHLERKVELIENLLRETATANFPKLGCGGDTSNSLPNNEYGYGIINVKKAIDKCSLENNNH